MDFKRLSKGNKRFPKNMFLFISEILEAIEDEKLNYQETLDLELQTNIPYDSDSQSLLKKTMARKGFDIKMTHYCHLENDNGEWYKYVWEIKCNIVRYMESDDLPY